jgi:tRNA_anti-like
MQRRTITILIIIGALLLSFMYGWIEYHRESKSLNNVEAAFSSDAAQLISEFESNNAAAEKKYSGRVLEVNGNIKQVEKDSDGNYTLVLGAASGMSAVRCSMDSTINDELLNIKDGDHVTVRGNFTGYQKDETGLLGSDIQLNRAVIAKKN